MHQENGLVTQREGGWQEKVIIRPCLFYWFSAGSQVVRAGMAPSQS